MANRPYDFLVILTNSVVPLLSVVVSYIIIILNARRSLYIMAYLIRWA